MDDTTSTGSAITEPIATDSPHRAALMIHAGLLTLIVLDVTMLTVGVQVIS